MLLIWRSPAEVRLTRDGRVRAAWQAVPSVRACAGRVNGPLLNTAMQIMVAMDVFAESIWRQ